MRILIADFDPARSTVLAKAASARGYAVDTVRHGAAALELSLERVPDVVICPIDLPVIDGERLAEILRGNPRTRHASFIYLLKDELDAPMAMSPRDGTVVPPWHEEDVLDHIDAFVERTARFGEARSDTEIEGKLTQISIVDLLQIFQMNKRSGTVRVWRSGGAESGAIVVRSGQIVDASVPLPDASTIVGEKALYRLLTWKEGRFEFAPGSVSEKGRIQKASREVLLEGIRQMDEFDKLRRELPGDDVRLSLHATRDQIPGSDAPLVIDVLDAVEAYRRVGEIIDHSAAPDYQVLRVLKELLARGCLAPEMMSEAPESGGADAIFTPSQLRRLRDWAAAQVPRSGSVLKLLLVTSAGEQLASFHEALRQSPDFMTDGRLLRERERMSGLTPLGHFSLGEGLTLRLLCVPSARHYAPLWEVAAHAMLGAIVLPRGPYGPALEETEAAFTRLREVAPQTIAHVIIADESEAERTRDQIAHLEGGSVFVLPAAPGAEQLPVLRNLFARVVP